MLIKVTQEDIDKGIAQNCIYCPVARAINKVLKNCFYVSVQKSYSSYYTGITLYDRISLPYIVETFINNFDQGFKVKPFEFELDIPEELLKC